MTDQPKPGSGPKHPLPQKFQTLEGILDYHEDYLRKWWSRPELKPDESFMPMFLLVCRNGDLCPMLTQMTSEDQKEALAHQLRHLFKEFKVVRYCMMSEAWTRVQSADEPVVLPSTREDRKEVMIITAADRHKAKARVLHIERDWGTGKVTGLVREEDYPEEVGINGRFAGLLAE